MLFCSAECKKGYLKKKVNRIKAEYPKYYDKIIKNSKNVEEHPFWIPQNPDDFDGHQKSKQLKKISEEEEKRKSIMNGMRKIECRKMQYLNRK